MDKKPAFVAVTEYQPKGAMARELAERMGWKIVELKNNKPETDRRAKKR